MSRFVALVGGRSTEHDASYHSYLGLLEALRARPGVLELAAVCFISRRGVGYVHRAPPWPTSYDALAVGSPLSTAELALELSRLGHFVFSLLIGNEGEDGAWQGVAEVLGLHGSFGPVLASALTMNKWAQSLIARAVGEGELHIPTTHLVDRRAGADALDAIAASFAGRACVVKPNRMGASLLTWRLESPAPAELAEHVAAIRPFDDQVLIQEYVAGAEYTCGCLERDGAIVSLATIEARTASGFLGHHEKHGHGLITPVFPDDDDAIARRLGALSRRLFAAFDLFAMCRFDYIVEPGGRIYFLEANSLPGLMPGSAYPVMLRRAGLDLVDLVQCCMDAAACRPARDKILPYEIHH